jgi:hypothetical protein
MNISAFLEMKSASSFGETEGRTLQDPAVQFNPMGRPPKTSGFRWIRQLRSSVQFSWAEAMVLPTLQRQINGHARVDRVTGIGHLVPD